MSQKSPSVLFLCIANSCRSQMAEAMARKKHPHLLIDSAGDHPAGMIHPGARRFMESLGFDLSTQRCKHRDSVLPLTEYSAVIGLCSEACSVLPKEIGAENWNIPDPTAVGGVAQDAAFQIIYDSMNSKIDDLFRRLLP